MCIESCTSGAILPDLPATAASSLVLCTGGQDLKLEPCAQDRAAELGGEVSGFFLNLKTKQANMLKLLQVS